MYPCDFMTQYILKLVFADCMTEVQYNASEYRWDYLEYNDYRIQLNELTGKYSSEIHNVTQFRIVAMSERLARQFFDKYGIDILVRHSLV